MHKPLSRQLRWQLKRMKKGLCRICGAPRGRSPWAGYCLPCVEKRKDKRMSIGGKPEEKHK